MFSCPFLCLLFRFLSFLFVSLKYHGEFTRSEELHFSRMRSEGFPFIVGGLGVGAMFAWRASSRRLSSFVVVSRRLSSSSRLKFAAIGGSFCK